MHYEDVFVLRGLERSSHTLLVVRRFNYLTPLLYVVYTFSKTMSVRTYILVKINFQKSHYTY